MTRVLDVSGLEGGYDKVQIMNGLDLYVDEGEFVTVIGPPPLSRLFLVLLRTTEEA